MKRKKRNSRKGAAYSVDATLAIFLTLVAILAINGYFSRIGYNKFILAQPTEIVGDMMTVAQHQGLLRDFYLENEFFFTKQVMDASRSPIGPDSAGAHHGTYHGNVFLDHEKDDYSRFWAVFGGDGDYITISESTNFDFHSRPFTITFWMKKTANTNSFQRIISRGDGSSGYEIIEHNGEIIVRTYDDTSAETTANGITSGLWHHVAVVREENGALKIYIDNVPINSSNHANFNSVTLNFTIGTVANLSTNEYDFNGSLDDIRVFNRALSATGSGSINQVYQNNSVTSGLIALYNFNSYTRSADIIQQNIPSQYRIAMLMENSEGVRVANRPLPYATSLRKFVTSGERIVAVEKNNNIEDIVKVRYYAWTQ